MAAHQRLQVQGQHSIVHTSHFPTTLVWADQAQEASTRGLSPSLSVSAAPHSLCTPGELASKQTSVFRALPRPHHRRPRWAPVPLCLVPLTFPCSCSKPLSPSEPSGQPRRLVPSRQLASLTQAKPGRLTRPEHTWTLLCRRQHHRLVP